jgi:hypothetical protein
MAEENKTIKTTIKCRNIAPLENLDKEIQSNSLKIAVYANNGSGKTFISRLFRLTEKQPELQLKEDGTSPNTHYLYHTFNQDYVEDNIRALNYEKDSDVQGFILGKAQIDLTDDENKLAELETNGKTLQTQIGTEIDKYLEENINNIRDIKRLSEYALLNVKNIFDGVNKDKQNVSKTFDDLLADYNKIKSVPENLSDIQELKKIEIDFQRFNEIKDADKSLLLQNGTLKDFNQNLTVPYISHLLDIYKVARKEGTVNHTTANSIRHIIETLTKFQNIEVDNNSIKEYIKENIPNDKKSYTLINDLSHGGWRSEQSPITEDEYKEVCETIIQHIEKTFKKQIEYCSKI